MYVYSNSNRMSGGFFFGGANLTSNAVLTGTAAAPTAANGTNTTQLATTAFVTNYTTVNTNTTGQSFAMETDKCGTTYDGSMDASSSFTTFQTSYSTTIYTIKPFSSNGRLSVVVFSDYTFDWTDTSIQSYTATLYVKTDTTSNTAIATTSQSSPLGNVGGSVCRSGTLFPICGYWDINTTASMVPHYFTLTITRTGTVNQNKITLTNTTIRVTEICNSTTTATLYGVKTLLRKVHVKSPTHFTVNQNFTDASGVLASYVYTPLIAASNISYDVYGSYTVDGSGNDTMTSYLRINGTTRIADSLQTWGTVAGGDMRGTALFPMSGVYTNSTTSSITLDVTITNPNAVRFIRNGLLNIIISEIQR
jgi:hypothetical protein